MPSSILYAILLFILQNKTTLELMKLTDDYFNEGPKALESMWVYSIWIYDINASLPLSPCSLQRRRADLRRYVSRRVRQQTSLSLVVPLRHEAKGRSSYKTHVYDLIICGLSETSYVQCYKYYLHTLHICIGYLLSLSGLCYRYEYIMLTYIYNIYVINVF